MKEHGIIFSAPMVRAIIEGRKTMTRRLVKPQPRGGDTIVPMGMEHGWIVGRMRDSENAWRELKCPHPVGTRLWVRETWLKYPWINHDSNETFRIAYRATDENTYPSDPEDRWRPSIHMPRWAARIWLEVTAVRVERLHSITDSDAMQEGMLFLGGLRDFPNDAPWADPGDPEQTGYVGARGAFTWAWDRINGVGAWKQNPWVWAYTFKVLEIKK